MALPMSMLSDVLASRHSKDTVIQRVPFHQAKASQQPRRMQVCSSQQTGKGI